MKKIIIAVCYSNLWVALQIALFSFPFSKTFFSETQAGYYSILVFLFSFLVYALLRRDALQNKPDNRQQPQLHWIYSNRKFLLAASLAALVCILIFLFWLFPFRFILLWLLILPLLVFYNRIFEQKVSIKPSLRKMGPVKPLVITICVVFIAYYVPLLNGICFFDKEFSFLKVSIEGLALFFFVLALVLPFDIRDMEYDRNAGVKTIPLILGARKTRVFCMLLLLFYALLYTFIGLLELNSFSNIWPHFITAIAGVALFADKDLTQESWEYLFWVDGLLGLPAFLLLAF